MFGPITSGIFAALVAIGATVAIERLGGRIGGVLGSIPTTIVPASLGFFLPDREQLSSSWHCAQFPWECLSMPDFYPLGV